MARENVGAIYYTVEADTAPLVKGGRAAADSLTGMERGLKKTDKAANDSTFRLNKTAAAVKGLGRQSTAAAAAMGSLSGLLSGLLTIRTAMAIIQTAEAYGEMSERIRMASSDAREYNMVQARLLDTANNTYRSLAEAQEVYIRTADTLRSMGHTTSEVLDITDSLSYLFVTNATSAERAEGAISAYSKAMSKGKVEADAWESILAATPSIIGDIAAATKLSEGEIRKLGASGKLTADQLNLGLSQSLEKNRAAAAGMATTVKDAFTALRNNIAVYLGEANKATEATGLLSSGILKIADAVKNSSVEELAREIDAVKLAMETISDLATEWLGPFMKSTEDATNFLPTSFAKGVLATAKELDGLVSFFTGAVGAIEGVWNALASNIPAFFDNAWNEVLVDSATFVNKLADIVNKPIKAFGGEGIGKVSFGGGAPQAIVNLADAAREGWDNASKSLGLYDKALIRITSGTIQRAAEAAEIEYGDSIDRTNKKKKEDIELTDAQKKAAKELAKAREENRKVIAKMTQSLTQASLAGEALAIAQAKAQLNEFATPDQIARVEALAVALYKVQQAEAARKKVGETAQEVQEYVFGDVKPLSGGPFDDQTERYDAEAKAEQERYAAALDRLKKAKDAELLERQAAAAATEELEKSHLERMAALEQEQANAKTAADAAKVQTRTAAEQERYASELELLKQNLEKKHQLQLDYAKMEEDLAKQTAERQAQIEKAKQQVQLRAIGDTLGQMADDLMEYSKISGRENKSAFEAAKAAAIGQAIVNTYLAATGAYSAMASIPYVGPILGAAAAATAVAAGLANVSAIRSQTIGSKRYGGGVDPARMYRINEGGAPEVLNTASGQQFLLPNTRGEVVSNKNATSGGAQGGITVVFQNAPPGTVAQQRIEPDGSKILDVIIADVRSGGRAATTFEQTYGLGRKGT